LFVLALSRVRARGARSLLAAAGIAAAGAMLGTAVTVAVGLGDGFDRTAAQAGLPDVIARFDPKPRAALDRRVRSLPNIAARSYRSEVTGVPLGSSTHRTSRGAVDLGLGGRHGYAIVCGEDVRQGDRSGVVVERGLADEWGLHVGSLLVVGALGDLRVRGIAVAPDNVAYPLASVAHVYVDPAALRARGFVPPEPNMLLLWANDRSQLDATLTQAREQSFGIRNLRFLTRSGVRVLIDSAAGIVIALLVAFSLVALGAAAAILAASAHGEVQRRLPAIGVEKALGASRAGIAFRYALEGAIVSLPAGAAGIAAGTLLARGPSDRLLATLNELPPGGTLPLSLLGCLVGLVAVVAGAAAWPAWRAASRRPARILRAGDVSRRPLPGGGLPRGFAGLGIRLVAARPGRSAAVVAVLAVSAGVILLMLGMASLLDRLQHDPALLGKRYQLTLPASAGSPERLMRVPGVHSAASRYEIRGADSFELGESLRLIGYSGDHTDFESPPLAEGTRLRGRGETEVGVGLAEALGLRPGSTLAVAIPGGKELRLRVAGVVRALESDGRVAYVPAAPLLAAAPGTEPTTVLRLDPGASPASVRRRVELLTGELPARPTAATSRSRAFLGVLAGLLRVLAVVNGLICLYALVQALALTARERRSPVAVMRAFGAGRRTLALVFAGAAAAVVVPAVLLGALLESTLLAPVLGRLAAGYVSLPVTASLASVVLVAVAIAALAALASAWVARTLEREPIIAGLREE
jgi:putative ABC transport system permease protein